MKAFDASLKGDLEQAKSGISFFDAHDLHTEKLLLCQWSFCASFVLYIKLSSVDNPPPFLFPFKDLRISETFHKELGNFYFI